jgi:hypothetical protein
MNHSLLVLLASLAFVGGSATIVNKITMNLVLGCKEHTKKNIYKYKLSILSPLQDVFKA